ncbi:anti-repressor SinI family protein [Salipaludibacillus sp. HK11]|uniref:anti-repressor SinI family protein n=1 Tax=Salipaludibacillus sp. HK11 TaxID=3394320 RepID=UPI0039FC7450
MVRKSINADLDKEWQSLMIKAKNQGMTAEEVRNFLQDRRSAFSRSIVEQTKRQKSSSA